MSALPELQTATEPRVAPVLLARIGGVAADVLADLRAPRALALLAAADAHAAPLGELGEQVEAALFAAVPRLEGSARRTALALKRDVHNGRTPSAEQVVGLAPRLDALDAERLERWRRLAACRDAALAGARTALEPELERAGHTVASGLRDPALLRGLALASPSLAEELLRLGPDAAPAPASSLGRSCTAYLSRAAVKTSPFSTLTTLALAGFGAPDGSVRTGGLAVAPPALATELLLACAADPRLGTGLLYETTPLVARYASHDGFLWRHDLVVQAETALAPSQRLDWAAACERVGGPGRLVRLVATGVVRPVAPWARDEPQPLLCLATTIEPADPALATIVRQLDGLVSGVATAGGGERPALVRRIAAAAEAAVGRTRRRRAPWIAGAPLVHEDVAADIAPLALPAAVEDELRSLGDVLRPHIVRSRLYDDLVDDFVARHGAGGRCADVLPFLIGHASRPRGRALAAMQADVAAAIRGMPPGAADGVAPPTTAVFFQLAARSARALEAGEFLLVLNQLNPGAGALLARSARLFGDALPAAIAGWTADMHPDALAVEVPVSADWNGLQDVPPLLPRLDWPGELARADDDGCVQLADLALVHDAGTGALALRHADGRAVAPVYLGTVPQHLVSGPLRPLLTLANPWIAADPALEALTPKPVPAAGEVHATARVQHGRIVLRRARWRIPAQDFPGRRPGEDDLAVLARAAAWRRRHNLPAEVFVTVDRGRPGWSVRERKPVWLRFDSLHALDAVARLVGDDARAVDLVESLPGPGQHWLRDERGRPRAAELIAHLRWEAS